MASMLTNEVLQFENTRLGLYAKVGDLDVVSPKDVNQLRNTVREASTFYSLMNQTDRDYVKEMAPKDPA